MQRDGPRSRANGSVYSECLAYNAAVIVDEFPPTILVLVSGAFSKLHDQSGNAVTFRVVADEGGLLCELPNLSMLKKRER
jgi:hypothetical protein